MSHSGIKPSKKAEKKMIIGVQDRQRNIGAKMICPYLIRLSLEPGRLIISADN